MKPLLNIFVIGDNHFRHFNIIRYTNRPFKSLEEQDKTMLKRWNSIIKPQDLVIHLGDIVLTRGKSKEISKIISQLNGRKILIKGNHDRKSHSFYLTNGFDFICSRFIWHYNRKKILFIHNPHQVTYHDWNTCNYVIHGHTHNKGNMFRKRKNCTFINVSVEHIKYTPQLLITLLNQRKGG